MLTKSTEGIVNTRVADVASFAFETIRCRYNEIEISHVHPGGRHNPVPKGLSGARVGSREEGGAGPFIIIIIIIDGGHIPIER